MINELHSESLGKWAKRCSVSYRTAWRWYHANQLPKEVVAEQMPSGTILIRDGRRAPNQAMPTGEATIYARINPRQKLALMQEQVDVCRAFCVARGWSVARIVRESAPGVGPQRIKLARLIAERIPRLVIARTSVLSRFDFRFYEALWQGMESELIIVDRSDEIAGKGGALEDLTDAINITCHRHYGPKRGSALVRMLHGVIQGTTSV